MNYQQYLQTEHWQLLRQAVFDRHERKCIICLSERRIEVHHWRYGKTWYDTTIYDLLPLCSACHGMVHRHNNEHFTKAQLIDHYREQFMHHGVKKKPVIVTKQQMRPRVLQMRAARRAASKAATEKWGGTSSRKWSPCAKY